MDIRYTYLLKNKTTGMFYYGVKYGKGAHPEKFWKTYFTSSKLVKQLIEQYGKDDFVYEIRKSGFPTTQAARKWEHKVLRRLRICSRSDFLNIHDGSDKFINNGNYKLTETTKKRQGDSKRGTVIISNSDHCIRVYPPEADYLTLHNGYIYGFGKHTKNTRNSRILVKLGDDIKYIAPYEESEYLGNGWERYGRPSPMKGKSNISRIDQVMIEKGGVIRFIDEQLLHWFTDDGWNRHSGAKALEGKILINNGVKTVAILPEELSDYDTNIWKTGSLNAKGRKLIDVKCPHCTKVGNDMIMQRWHFDKCKFKE